MSVHRLSKTRYLSGCQCHLKLWYDCYARDLASPVDAVTQAVFNTGHAVGRVARERHPGGVLVEADHRQPDKALRETAKLVGEEDVPAIFEGAFEHQGVLIRVDILERAKSGRFHLIEVKSSTSAKDVHHADVAVQAWVLRGAGIELASAGVLTLNRTYVYDGEHLDVRRLFRFHDLGEQVEEQLHLIGGDISMFRAMLAAGRAPEIEPGSHCFDPYECGYYAHCTKDRVLPVNPITELPGLHRKKREQLESQSVVEVAQIPDDFPLSPLQCVVRRSVITGSEHIASKLPDALSAVTYPVHYLDFETVGPAIPRYAGTRPYDSIPFQFSLHTEDEKGRISHREFFWEEQGDPRPALATSLIEALGEQGTICVYSSFERGVIKQLANSLPRFAPALEGLLPRLWDLLKIIRSHYYHPDFHGSFSIKQVLPVLVSDMSYDDMEIADGMVASVAYQNSLDCDDAGERERVFAALRDYCRQDTLAMLELRQVLMQKALNSGSASAP